MNAFIHRPKGRLAGEFFHPVHTKLLWVKVWDAASAQPWFGPNVDYVGNQDGYFYFQKPGVTTGFARVKVS